MAPLCFITLKRKRDEVKEEAADGSQAHHTIRGLA